MCYAYIYISYLFLYKIGIISNMHLQWDYKQIIWMD